MRSNEQRMRSLAPPRSAQMVHFKICFYRTRHFAAIVVFFSLTCDALAQAPLRSKDMAYSIAYTGGLLGYARTPESQTLEDQFCKDPRDSDPSSISPFTTAMLKLAEEGHSLLVGMGNNF